MSINGLRGRILTGWRVYVDVGIVDYLTLMPTRVGLANVRIDCMAEVTDCLHTASPSPVHLCLMFRLPQALETHITPLTPPPHPASRAPARGAWPPQDYQRSSTQTCRRSICVGDVNKYYHLYCPPWHWLLSRIVKRSIFSAEPELPPQEAVKLLLGGCEWLSWEQELALIWSMYGRLLTGLFQNHLLSRLDETPSKCYWPCIIHVRCVDVNFLQYFNTLIHTKHTLHNVVQYIET